MPSSVSTGLSSSTEAMVLQPRGAAPSARRSTTASDSRFPRPKGTITRTPGRTFPSSSSGTR